MTKIVCQQKQQTTHYKLNNINNNRNDKNKTQQNDLENSRITF